MATIEGEFIRIKRRKSRKNRLSAVGDPGSYEFDIGAGQDVAPDDVSTVNTFASQFNAAVAKFQAASDALDAAESAAIATQVDIMANGTEAQKAEFSTRYNAIIAAQSTRDSALSAIQTARDWYNAAANALGLGGILAAPWGVIGIIVAATAALWVVVNSMNSAIDNYRAAVGLPPIPRAPGVLDTVSNIALYAAVALVAWLFISKG